MTDKATAAVADAPAARSRFGVEDLLGEGARVVFENIFSTRHIGRVIDLMLHEARMFLAAQKEPEQAEYRAREILVLQVFNAWVNYRSGQAAKCVELEVGWDRQKMVLSASFYAPTEAAGFVPAADATPQGEASKRIRAMLERTQVASDGLIVRHEPSTGRVQMIALVAGERIEARGEAQYYRLDKLEPRAAETQRQANPGAPGTTPEALSVGDIENFLADEREEGGKKTPVSPAKEGEPEERRFKADPVKSEVRRVVGGPSDPEIEEIFRITGEGADAAPEKIVVVGENAPEDLGEVVVKGGEEKIDAAYAENSVQGLLETIKSEVLPLCPGVSEAEMGEGFRVLSEKVRDQYAVAIRHVVRVKNIQMVAKAKQFKATIAVMMSKIEDLSSRLRIAEGAISAKDGPGMTEIAAANAKLHEVEAASRKTVFEARTRENAIREKLRVKDQALKQKDLALANSKESLTNTLALLEKMKSIADGDAAALPGRVANLERLLENSRQNGERLQKRLDEVQQKAVGESRASPELKALTLERDRSVKIIEELRRKNREVEKSLADATLAAKSAAAAVGAGKRAGITEDAELRHKLEHANKLVKAFKEDAERGRKRYDDLKLEETKLRVEIGKLQAQIKSAGRGGR